MRAGGAVEHSSVHATPERFRPTRRRVHDDRPLGDAREWTQPDATTLNMSTAITYCHQDVIEYIERMPARRQINDFSARR